MNIWNLIMLKLKAAYETHIANSAAHHNKYTDAEAVTAVDAADDYIKNSGGDWAAGQYHVVYSTYPVIALERSVSCADAGYACFECAARTAVNMTNGFGSGVTFAIGDDTKAAFGNYIVGLYGVRHDSDTQGALEIRLDHNDWSAKYRFDLNSFDMMNKSIKDIKNHTHSALSGTKKLVEIVIGGVPYYFEVYPTKA